MSCNTARGLANVFIKIKISLNVCNPIKWIGKNYEDVNRFFSSLILYWVDRSSFIYRIRFGRLFFYRPWPKYYTNWLNSIDNCEHLSIKVDESIRCNENGKQSTNIMTFYQRKSLLCLFNFFILFSDLEIFIWILDDFGTQQKKLICYNWWVCVLPSMRKIYNLVRHKHDC